MERGDAPHNIYVGDTFYLEYLPDLDYTGSVSLFFPIQRR
jgi:hypothetical protein